MRFNKLIAGLMLAGVVTIPAHAEDAAPVTTVPTQEQVREQTEEMKQDAERMKQGGKEKAQQMKQMGKEKGEAGKAAGQQARDKAMSGEKPAGEAGAEAAETVRQSGDELKEEAKKVPPGMQKREEHPSTGKGSEQGQESRAPQEKRWWRFWGE
jgi:hypothetical protein